MSREREPRDRVGEAWDRSVNMAQQTIVLAHGILGFGSLPGMPSLLNYFNGVAAHLGQQGHTVIAPQVNPIGSIAQRGRQLAAAILAVPAATRSPESDRTQHGRPGRAVRDSKRAGRGRASEDAGHNRHTASWFARSRRCRGPHRAAVCADSEASRGIVRDQRGRVARPDDDGRGPVRRFDSRRGWSAIHRSRWRCVKRRARAVVVQAREGDRPDSRGSQRRGRDKIVGGSAREPSTWMTGRLTTPVRSAGASTRHRSSVLRVRYLHRQSTSRGMTRLFKCFEAVAARCGCQGRPRWSVAIFHDR